MAQSSEVKNTKKKKWLKYTLCAALLLALVALTFWYLFKDASPKEVFAVMKTADPWLLLVAVALTFGYVLFEGLGLFAVLRTHGNKTRLFSNVKYAAVDFYFCGITPSASGGQPVVAVFMAKDGVSVAFSTIVLLLSTATFKIVLVLLSIVALFFVAPMIFSSGVLLPVLFVVGMFINVAFIAFCLLLVYKPSVVSKMCGGTLKILHKLKIVKNIEKANAKLDVMIENYREGAEYARTHFGVIVRMLLYTVVQRVMLFSVGYVVAVALGAKDMNYFTFMSIQTIIATSVDSMPFPGGVGLSETFMKNLYSVVYPAELMMPALLLTRGISFYLLLLSTGLFILIYCVVRMIRGNIAAKRKENTL